MSNVIRSQVTGQYLCEVELDASRGPGPHYTPVWGDLQHAKVASMEDLYKCHCAGIFLVDVVPAEQR